MSDLNWYQRIILRLSKIAGLAAVSPVPIGRDDDGMQLISSGTRIDKPWNELLAEFEDAREAWRRNPLAKRLVGLITSYCVGNGIEFRSENAALNKFIRAFWDQNQMDERLIEWSDELTRSGELFPVIFVDPSGIPRVRAVPASEIQDVEWLPGDYETELRYRERDHFEHTEERWWLSPKHPDAKFGDKPVMLHFAVNRPVGAVRGESDLASILPWLRRYSAWLEDRVRLNAGVRSFLWIVYTMGGNIKELATKYRTPPAPGSVIIAEEGVERWEAVAPTLQARDASADGRAIRWMVVAGGPGTSLLDLGEGEDSNLATGKAMAEQRRRFLRRRQAYLVWLVKEVLIEAYTRRSIQSGRAQMLPEDILAVTPDISPEDNVDLSTAAKTLIDSVAELQTIVGASTSLRRMTLNLFVKFIGEQMTEGELDEILEEGEADLEEQKLRQEQAEQDQEESDGDDDE